MEKLKVKDFKRQLLENLEAAWEEDKLDGLFQIEAFSQLEKVLDKYNPSVFGMMIAMILIGI